MTKSFKELYEKTEDLLIQVNEPMEQMTLKEIQEHYYEMRDLMQEYIDVFNSETLLELCTCKQPGQ